MCSEYILEIKKVFAWYKSLIHYWKLFIHLESNEWIQTIMMARDAGQHLRENCREALIFCWFGRHGHLLHEMNKNTLRQSCIAVSWVAICIKSSCFHEVLDVNRSSIRLAKSDLEMHLSCHSKKFINASRREVFSFWSIHWTSLILYSSAPR